MFEAIQLISRVRARARIWVRVRFRVSVRVRFDEVLGLM